MLEYGCELVVVPRGCEFCWKHPAVVLWLGSWPSVYLCRPCVDEQWSSLEAAPWSRPIGALEADVAPRIRALRPVRP